MTVPLSTIKSALKIDFDDDDGDLTRLREAAISLIERRTQLVLTPQSLPLYLASWTDTMIPGYPFSTVTSVSYQNASNVTTTLDSSKWWVDRTDGPMPIIRFLDSPVTYQGTAITVTYSAGYSTMPNEITHCVIALVGGWYNNPEAFQAIGLSTVPMSVEFILESISVRSMLR